MDISNKISFDECNGCEPIYESEFGLNGSVKLRFFNGKEFCWLDYYPSNTIQGIWINNPFTVEDAKKQILECLSSSPYLIVSWKKSNIISSVGSFIDLSIIGVPKLYEKSWRENPFRTKGPDGATRQGLSYGMNRPR